MLKLIDDGSGASEILAIYNNEFLVDERDGKGLGDGTSAAQLAKCRLDQSAH